MPEAQALASFVRRQTRDGSSYRSADNCLSWGAHAETKVERVVSLGDPESE